MLLAGCGGMKFENHRSKTELLTVSYPVEQVEILKNQMLTERIAFSKVKKQFEIQCMRGTYQGYYVILQLEESQNSFLFFNKANELINIMMISEFMRKADFEIQKMDQMTMSEMLRFDRNTILVPISAIDITIHIVQEGICIVKYSRFQDGKVRKEPVAISMDFIENENIPISEDPFIKDGIPFILEIDKK